MVATLFNAYGTELAALLFNLVAFTAYRAVQRMRARHAPEVTLQSNQAAVRAQWVEEVLRSPLRPVRDDG
jgi:hypothetical protein